MIPLICMIYITTLLSPASMLKTPAPMQRRSEYVIPTRNVAPLANNNQLRFVPVALLPPGTNAIWGDRTMP